MSPQHVDRREFLLGLAAGGLLLVVSGSGCRDIEGHLTALAKRGPGGGDQDPEFEPAVYLRIAPGGLVTIIIHRSEMGQGTRTSLAMTVADELEADWAQVRVEQAPGDEKRYGNQDTDGSNSIRRFFTTMRQAGATGRAMLESAAAAKWGVPVHDVQARLHEVKNTRGTQTIGYGELVAIARTMPVPAPESVRLKDPSEFRYIGKGVPAVDAPDITVGAARYGIDQHVAGMKFAVVARPPVYGGTVSSLDSTAAAKIDGVVHIVRLDSTPPPSGMSPKGGVAVIANNTWSAIQGRKALRITWNDGPNASYESRAYRLELEQSARRPGKIARRQGDAVAAIAAAARRVSAEYYVPHLAHSPMEPVNALAAFKEGHCEIWAPTQNPQGARNEVARALGISVDNVRVNVTLVGGGFGRKSFSDFIIEAALLSRAVGSPVKVQWTREDDVQHDFYHPPAVEHLEAGLDRNGKVVAWLHRSTIPSLDSTTTQDVLYQADWELSMGLIDLPYAITNIQLEAGPASPHVRLGWYRSVLNTPHAFAIHSFVDELAHATGRDTRDMISELLGPDRVLDMDGVGLAAKASSYGNFTDYPVDVGRYRRVMELVARESGWGRPLPRGHGRGIAVVRASASYLASVVQVSVGPDGSIVIPRVDIGIDAGFIVNPDRVRAQMEGGTIMGLGNALVGEITFANGRVEQSNFDGYKVLRMNAAPREIHVHLVASSARPAGAGEPAVAPTAPALCNAIFAATGRRIRSLPVGAQLSHWGTAAPVS